MERKEFLKSTAIGLGALSIIPMLHARTSTSNKKNSTKLPNWEVSDLQNPKIVKDNEGEVLNVIGDIQTHKLIGSDTNNQIVEWVDNVEPGVGIPPHIHTKEDEIFRVIKGQVEIMVDGTSTILEAGDTAFAPKNIPHAWKVVGTEKAKMITSAFPAGIEKMFQELDNLPPGPPNFEQVAQICGKHGVSFVN